MDSICPRCKKTIKGVFPSICPECGFTIDDLAGRGTSSFQQKNWQQHTELLYGGTISLFGKEYNASFDYKGVAKLDEMVRFTITYGDRALINDSRGINQNPIIVSYFPEPIGSGTAIHYHQLVACSGLMLISPHSFDYAHAFPVIDDWMKATFPGWKSNCKLCGTETDFGQPICAKCYNNGNNQWTELL